MQFFVSYTGADTAWAEWIAWQLEASGHQVIIQAWDFRPGENFVVRMRRALDTADRTLAVVSAAYLESVYGSDEWTAAFVHDQSEKTSLLVIRVDDVQLPRLLRPWVYIDVVGLDEETAARRLLEGVQPDRRKPDQPPAFPPTLAKEKEAGPSYPGRGPEIWNMPPRNPVFTGRDELLDQLHQQLNSSSDGSGLVAVVAQTLYGLGGVGKSQLALEYSYRYAADYDLAWWIPAENPLSILAAFTRLAPKLGLAPSADQDELVTAVLDILRGRDRWLLLFDNAEEPTDLVPFHPTGGRGQVLVTSRNPAWGALGRTVRVNVLPRQQAVGLLLRRTSDQNPDAAEALAEALGDLPLALEQAAAYLEQTGMPLAAYMVAYQRYQQRLLAKGQAVAYKGQVDTTWQLSIDRVIPAGVELLRLCAFLAPEAIPLDLFAATPEQLPAALVEEASEDVEARLHEAAGACYRYSLVDRDQTGIRVHRLVQAVVHARLGEDTERSYAALVIRLLEASFPKQPHEVAAWLGCQQLLPHILAVTDHAHRLDVSGLEGAQLLDRASRYLRARGRFGEARSLANRALTVGAAALGPDHPNMASLHSTLGITLRHTGDLAAARKELERALVIGESTVGPDHPNMARWHNNLGNVLSDLGDHAGAIAQFERALVIGESTVGSDHPDMASWHNNLGITLRHTGDLAAARKELERALVIGESTVGPDRPEMAYRRNNLGNVLSDLGDHAGAMAQFELARAIVEPTLGPDHPFMGAIQFNLGNMLTNLGDLVGARAKHERALEIYLDVYGRDHHRTQDVIQAIRELEEL